MQNYTITIQYNLEIDPPEAKKRTFVFEANNFIGSFDAQEAGITALLKELHVEIDEIREGIDVKTTQSGQLEGNKPNNLEK